MKSLSESFTYKDQREGIVAGGRSGVYKVVFICVSNMGEITEWE